MKLTVIDILDLLSEDITPEELINEFPFLEKNDICAAILYNYPELIK